jgi:hypothetical protein
MPDGLNYSSSLNISTGLSYLGTSGGDLPKILRATYGYFSVVGNAVILGYTPGSGIGQPIGLLLALTKSS